jgi:hypothetical protein
MEKEPGPKPVSLPARWPLFAGLPVLPFVGAAVILQFLSPPPIDPTDYVKMFGTDASALMGHLGDRLTYAAMAYVQLATCVTVMAYYALRLHELDEARRRGAFRILAATAGCAAIAVVLVRSLRGAAYVLTFQNIRDLLQQTSVTHDFSLPTYHVPAIPYLADVTPVAVVVGLPFLFGVLAVIAAVPVSAATVTFQQIEDGKWQASFAERVAMLQRAFYALSVVLVTSTVALMLFFQLPAEIALDEGRVALLRYARGLTVFWGAVMTLTLLAVFIPPVLGLRSQAKARYRSVGDPREFNDWFTEQVPISPQRQLANLATMLAPIMIGPLGGLLQSLFGGG